MAEEMVNVICLKWGTRYPAAFTNRLFASVSRHLHRPFRFVCFTDDATGLAKGIDAQPLPENPIPQLTPYWPHIYIKLCLFKDGLANLKGPTIFFDVDVSILDDIDCLFEYMPGKNCMIHNWVERRKAILRRPPHVGNSSCFRFEAGASGYIYDCFMADPAFAMDHNHFVTEQAFMTYAMESRGQTVQWWPSDWVQSFKRACIPPFPLNLFIAPKKPKTRVLVFHGLPDPDMALAGFTNTKLHKRCLPAPWIADDWRE